MIKYLPDRVSIVLEEIPDRVSVAVDITNCPENCPGCHSPFLREDIGEELTFERIDSLISDNFGVNCFLLLGEGRDHQALVRIGKYISEKYPGIAPALYSGRNQVEDDIWQVFDYVKLGPYVEKKGPLNERTTNQRLYHVHSVISAGAGGSAAIRRVKEDITPVIWRRKKD
ncbi:MAG: anaerobic ribonucleoside-triphosphate reductase activating protein [Bacteroidales bacterium]|nr:anaerobic ribonucleoside-triphosphate reductase activating protein [Bacteroidales bacterium]MBQ9887852.1 anaerobic ribonucleoside-triphosphate reductase activating protein [Bacteroidales bacterium]